MKDIVKIIVSILFILQATTAYSENEILKKEQIIEDILFMDSIIQVIHPNPFYYISPYKYNLLKEKVVYDLQDSLSIEKIYLLISPILASLKDGHSMMLMPYDPLVTYLKSGGKVFPIDVYLTKDKLFAKYDCCNHFDFNDSTEIISINNIDVSDILSEIYKLYPIELSNDLFYNSIERDFYILLLYAQLLNEENVKMKIKNGGETADYNTRLVPYSSYNSYKKKQVPDNKYTYHIVDDKSTVEIKLGSFMPTPAYYRFIDSLFHDLENYSIKNMIIDIRGNSGGSSNAVDSLISYLYPDSFKLYSQIYLKVSEGLKKKYKSQNASQYSLIESEQIGSVIPEIINNTISTKSNIYDGFLKILVDKSTYSGAASFANLVSQLGRGEISGTTGSNDIYFGDFLIFKLPNTGLVFTISAKKFINYKAEPEKLIE